MVRPLEDFAKGLYQMIDPAMQKRAAKFLEGPAPAEIHDMLLEAQELAAALIYMYEGDPDRIKRSLQRQSPYVQDIFVLTLFHLLNRANQGFIPLEQSYLWLCDQHPGEEFSLGDLFDHAFRHTGFSLHFRKKG